MPPCALLSRDLDSDRCDSVKSVGAETSEPRLGLEGKDPDAEEGFGKT